MFTDIEGSTKILEERGDERAREIFRAHDEVVREAVGEHGGVEVEHQGDAFMLAFSSALRAVRCAMAAQRGLEQRSRQRPDSAVRVRIGLSTGEVIAEEAGYFGRVVFVAARVAGRARGGQILLSALTQGLLAGSDLELGDMGEHELKGLPGRHRLYEVRW